MKDYIKKHRVDIIIFILFLAFIVISNVLNFNEGKKIINNFKDSFIEMISLIPFMFILIGLFDVWVPKEKIEKHIGKSSGFLGILWVILLAMLQVGPLYGAFPVCYILWKKGSSIKNIFIYLGAFSTMKIPMLAFEIGFLGLKFTILRTIITLPIFIIIGYLMESIFDNKDFEVKSLK
ncbi:MAG: hypothetical protein A2086_00075 [Spirochaetes bacterium GWD1_27_9]|nr:MAG: hypothetical protein A2Z98_08390 [Spirochaetes bacterium GWB1_27_13]OHD36101.1 MAG: hypothetical protein A2086_00075 [Spirochaetes bacterium GWD1_27_9]